MRLALGHDLCGYLRFVFLRGAGVNLFAIPDSTKAAQHHTYGLLTDHHLLVN